jgi:hypothetical protein
MNKKNDKKNKKTWTVNLYVNQQATSPTVMEAFYE